MRLLRYTLSIVLVMVAGTLREPSPVGATDFWDELARCESTNGALSSNLYQFTAETGAKVGIPNPGAASPARQLQAAKDWAAIIHPNEGTAAGWPECWWVALAASGSTPSANEEDEVEAPAPVRTAQPKSPTSARIALTG